MVLLLAGPGEAMKTESLKKYESETIWQDPTLNRAFRLWGGVPRVDLIAPDKTVPEPMQRSLSSRVTPDPGQGH